MFYWCIKFNIINEVVFEIKFTNCKAWSKQEVEKKHFEVWVLSGVRNTMVVIFGKECKNILFVFYLIYDEFLDEFNIKCVKKMFTVYLPLESRVVNRVIHVIFLLINIKLLKSMLGC